MRYTITNRPELLKEGDEVLFVVNGRGMTHHITRDRLAYLDGTDRAIFDRLEIEDRFSFAKVVYGYEPENYCFPEWKRGDMEAATRLVNALFDVIDGREKAGVEAPALKFKVGDRVRLTDEDEAPLQREGALGTIVQVDDDSLPYRVEWDEGEGDFDWMSEGSIEAVEGEAPAPEAEAPAPETPRFKIGDRVRRVDREIGTVPAGALGTVIGVENGDEVRVQFDDMRLYTKDAGNFADSWDALELVTEEAPAPPPKFKIGDMVEGIAASGTRYHGKFLGFTDSGKGEIEDPGNHPWIVDPRSIRLLSAAPVPEKAPDTLRDFLESLPEDLREFMNVFIDEAPKIRTFVFAASVKDGEKFNRGGYYWTSRGSHDGLDSVPDCIGLATVVLRRMEDRI